MRGGSRQGSGRPYVKDSERKVPIGFGARLSMIRDIDTEVHKLGLPSRSEWLRRIVTEALGETNEKPAKKKPKAKKASPKKATKKKKARPKAAKAPTPPRYQSVEPSVSNNPVSGMLGE